MSDNVHPAPPFSWTAAREEAAALVAQGELTDLEIAAKVKITDRQLRRWRKHPDFAARVDQLVNAAREAVKARGIAAMENRMAVLDSSFGKLQELIAARGRTYKNQAPGADTGLLVPKPRLIKVYEVAGPPDEDDDEEDPAAQEGDGEVLYSGKRSVTVVEWTMDTAVLHELREHIKLATQLMMGEWSERKELTGKDGGLGVAITDYREAIKPLMHPGYQPGGE